MRHHIVLLTAYVIELFVDKFFCVSNCPLIIYFLRQTYVDILS